MGWTGPMTERQYRANHAHLCWRYRTGDDGPDLSTDGVPAETRKRWEAKVSGAKFTMAEKVQAGAARAAQAEREIANQRKAATQEVSDQRN